MIRSCATLLSLVLATTSVLASQPLITMSTVSGKVLVQGENGYTAVTPGADLMPGQSIVVGQDSFATITHGTCQIDLKPGTLYTVSKTAPCADGAVAAVGADTLIVPANSHSEGGLDPRHGLLIVGGVIVAGGVLTYALTRKKHRSPAASAR